MTVKQDNGSKDKIPKRDKSKETVVQQFSEDVKLVIDMMGRVHRCRTSALDPTRHVYKRMEY